MNILLIKGATRPNNLTSRAVKFVEKYFQNKYPEIILKSVSPLDFPMDYDDQKNEEYLKLASEADAFILLFPEYNHSYPGKLKTLLDSANEEYHYKHVLLGGVSDGPFGGARAIENITPIIKCFRMYMSKDDMIFPKIDQILDLEGNSLDPSHAERVYKVVDNFVERCKKK